VPEQVVGGHRNPPSRVSVGEATIRQLSRRAGCRSLEWWSGRGKTGHGELWRTVQVADHVEDRAC